MPEELYVNKRGFKCVRSQLAKTDGRDPQEHAAALQSAANNGTQPKEEVAKLKVRATEYVDQ